MLKKCLGNNILDSWIDNVLTKLLLNILFLFLNYDHKKMKTNYFSNITTSTIYKLNCLYFFIFRPWWDNIEDFVVYGLIMLGLIVRLVYLQMNVLGRIFLNYCRDGRTNGRKEIVCGMQKELTFFNNSLKGNIKFNTVLL